MAFIFLIFALFFRIISGSIANVYQKKLTQNKLAPLFVNSATYILLSIICLPIAVIYCKSFNAEIIYTALIVGILGSAGNGFLVKALQAGDLSILGPINAYKSVFGLIFAFIFLKEIPDFIGIAGIILIIFGSYFVLDTTEERFTPALLLNKSIQYRFLALLLCSAEAVFIKKLIELSDISEAFVLWCFSGALFSIILIAPCKIKIKTELQNLKHKNLFSLFMIVLFIGIMQFTTNYVFKNMNVAYALALFQLSSLVSIFFGYKIFKETDIPKKLLGTAIMITGAVLIILYN